MPRLAALAVPALVLALVGCVPDPAPTPVVPGAITTGTNTPTPMPTSTPTATVTPTPGPETEPVAEGCADIISAQALYDYNPNVSLLESFQPNAGSLAGDAVTQEGIACRIVNQTSGDTIDLGVVHFTDDAFAAKERSVSASSTPADAFDGYFDVVDGQGVAQAFTSPYWITITSTDFAESGDAASLVYAALSGVS